MGEPDSDMEIKKYWDEWRAKDITGIGNVCPMINHIRDFLTEISIKENGSVNQETAEMLAMLEDIRDAASALRKIAACSLRKESCLKDTVPIICQCGDQIVPNDDALCGTCALDFHENKRAIQSLKRELAALKKENTSLKTEIAHLQADNRSLVEHWNQLWN